MTESFRSTRLNYEADPLIRILRTPNLYVIEVLFVAAGASLAA